MFKNNQTDNKQEETKTQDIKNKYYQGKHLNKKLYKICFITVILFIVYNIFKAPTPSPTPQKESKSTTEETTVKENPFNKTYKEVKDIELKDSYQNNGQQNSPQTTYNEALAMEQEQKMEKLRKLEEEAEQAKRSAISFQIYNAEPQNQQQVVAQNAYVDYDQNRNGSKKSFLMNEESQSFYSSATIIDPISPYELKAGDFIPSIVETAMNSDIYGKVVVAKVTQNIYDTVTGKYLLIPQGTTLTGVYDSNITWGQERLLVVWQRLRFPNGSSIRLDNMQGVDMIGQAGLKGKVNNHFATLLKGVLLSSAMGATAAIVTDDSDDDWKSSAGEGAGLAVIQIGDKFTTKALDRQPTIEIKTGERFNVMVHSDLILKPYKKR